MGPAVGKDAQLRHQSLQHAIDIVSYIEVRETDRRVAVEAVEFVAGTILLGTVGIAIYLDYERLLGTEKVDDALFNDVLTTKFES